MKRLIIADTGPLIIFAKSARLSMLSEMTSQILVTNTVMHECTDDTNKPGTNLILKAFEDQTLTLIDDVELNEALNKTLLDDGEKSAIALAMQMNDQKPSILIDEVRGRNVAKKNGLIVIGSAGILIAAKKMGLIQNVEQIIIEWQSLGYFVSQPLIEEVLIKAGERNTPRP
ncbi:MAG: DUF3368 domain-containing protein [Methylophilaceae bacterium]